VDTLNPLTIRERLRIQGAPDNFIIQPLDYMKDHKSYMKVYKQTGKFMPVEFCKYFAELCQKYIEGGNMSLCNERQGRQEELLNTAKKHVCRKGKDCEYCWLINDCHK
jgi:hypothetical protein